MTTKTDQPDEQHDGCPPYRIIITGDDDGFTLDVRMTEDGTPHPQDIARALAGSLYSIAKMADKESPAATALGMLALAITEQDGGDVTVTDINTTKEA